MKKFAKICSSLLATAIVAGSVLTNATEIKTFSNDLTVYYNGVNVYENTQNKPIIINDRTMVQIRPIFEMMGYTAKYNDENKSAGFESGDGTMIYSFQAESNKVFMTELLEEHMYEAATLDVPAMIYNDTFYIPLRAFCELFDFRIKWNDNTRCAEISSNETGVCLSREGGRNELTEWVKNNQPENDISNCSFVFKGSYRIDEKLYYQYELRTNTDYKTLSYYVISAAGDVAFEGICSDGVLQKKS